MRKSQQQLFVENCDNIVATCAEAKALAQEKDWEGALEALAIISDEVIEAEQIGEKKLHALRLKVATGL